MAGDRNENDAVTYLGWERQDYREALEGIREGFADYMAGRTQPLNEVFEKLLEERTISALR